MKKHFKNLELFVCSIYAAIFVVITSTVGLFSSLITTSFGFSFFMNILGLILFVPTLYAYYVKKSIDKFGRDLEKE